jgi:hypothetical protein
MKAILAGHLAYECECGQTLQINYVRQKDQAFFGKHLVCRQPGCKYEGKRFEIPTVELKEMED